MRKREKMQKGVYYKGRPTKQLLQHLGGFWPGDSAQCTAVEKGEDRYLYSQTLASSLRELNFDRTLIKLILEA